MAQRHREQSEHKESTYGAGPKTGGATRRNILHYLRVRGRMHASELAHVLELTEMAIRRHMHELEREGAVRIITVRQAMGRPLHAFELTEQAEQYFPKNYHSLTIDLLAELERDEETAVLIDQMFLGRKNRLLDRYAPRMDGKNLSQRVTELAIIQNAGGYMAEVEERPEGGYVLHEYNCPIKGVADQYQQACSCELALFTSLLGADVDRTECLAKGGGRCSYEIKDSSQSDL
ncbi:helix-turn-helix transcriptional regulator [Paenibacillus sp. CAU 1782]